MDNITASEIAGFGVGALLLCATVAAPKVDAFISSSQRSALGMCKRCGDLKMVACSQCKGTGSVKKGSFFGLSVMDDLYGYLGNGRAQNSLAPCIKCQSKGCSECPDCSKLA